LIQKVGGVKNAKLGIIGGNVVTFPHSIVRQWGVKYGVPLIGSGYAEMSIYYGKYVFGTGPAGSYYELLSGFPGEELVKSDMSSMQYLICLAMIFIGLVHSLLTRKSVKPQTLKMGGKI
jgi:hypothetical protein